MNDIKPTQVTLQLDLGNSALTLENILSALTVSDRKVIAKELVADWVKQPEVKVKEKLINEVHAAVVSETMVLIKEVVHNAEHMQDLISSVAMKIVDRIPEMAESVVKDWFRNEIRYKLGDVVGDDAPLRLREDIQEIRQRLGMI